MPGGVEEAVLETDFELQAPNVLPIIEIGNASYGHPTDPKHIFDVTPEMRRIVTKAGGYRIHLSKEESMWHIFNDPARGIRKKLNVFYSVRGYMGNVRIRTKFGKLQADCELGYRPEAGLESGLTRQIDANDHEGMAFQRRMELMAAVQAVRPKDSASGNDTAYDALDGVEKKLSVPSNLAAGTRAKRTIDSIWGKRKAPLTPRNQSVRVDCPSRDFLFLVCCDGGQQPPPRRSALVLFFFLCCCMPDRGKYRRPAPPVSTDEVN